MTDAKPYRHRFPITIIEHAVWLYHRFPLSYRDVQELLHQRGIQVSHETLREWCIKFASRFAQELRHRQDQKKQAETSVPDLVNRRGRGGLKFRPPLPSICRRPS